MTLAQERQAGTSRYTQTSTSNQAVWWGQVGRVVGRRSISCAMESPPRLPTQPSVHGLLCAEAGLQHGHVNEWALF